MTVAAGSLHSMVVTARGQLFTFGVGWGGRGGPDLCGNLEKSSDQQEVSLLANDIYDKSSAYLKLREFNIVSKPIQQ